MFNFFAASAHRWEVLQEHTKVLIKRLSKTRWSAHHSAVRSVKEQFDECVAAVEALCDPCENVDTIGTA